MTVSESGRFSPRRSVQSLHAVFVLQPSNALHGIVRYRAVKAFLEGPMRIQPL
ncbi:hypothetical protein HSR121_1173 [Halapricum desulfuricans]|uniref:Uncharacterized protein n=1 Tax=Halapricum desulfuricans TaxID=2841257 RepID=A0A897MTQ9_9EURY|nr:hypothetical protein HSR121_1173 [Halapricum desulfuricans]